MDKIQLARLAIQKAFPGIYSQEVEKMISIGEVKEYPPDTCLCQEGAVEETFYILLGGEVSVTKVINNEEERLLNTLQVGDFFGEMSLLTGERRSASVVAEEETKVAVVDKNALADVLAGDLDSLVALSEVVEKRMQESAAARAASVEDPVEKPHLQGHSLRVRIQSFLGIR